MLPRWNSIRFVTHSTLSALKNLQSRNSLLHFSSNMKTVFAAASTSPSVSIEKDTPLELNQDSNIVEEMPGTEHIGKSMRRQTRSQVPKLDPKILKTYPQVTFTLKHVEGGPLKLWKIADFISGLNVREALDQLQFLHTRRAMTVYHFLKNASLNCENTHKLNSDRLLINHVKVGRGMIRRRVRIHARGKNGVLRHQTSHLKFTLIEVPYIEGERKLGNFGWRNSTWEKFQAEAVPFFEQIKEVVSNKKMFKYIPRSNAFKTDAVQKLLAQKRAQQGNTSSTEDEPLVENLLRKKDYSPSELEQAERELRQLLENNPDAAKYMERQDKEGEEVEMKEKK